MLGDVFGMMLSVLSAVGKGDVFALASLLSFAGFVLNPSLQRETLVQKDNVFFYSFSFQSLGSELGSGRFTVG